MDEDTNQIERDIVAERHQLGRNLTELEMKAQQLTDWRTHYRKNPKVLLSLALGGGFVMGAMARRGRSRSADAGATARSPRPQSRTSRQIESTLFSVSDALLGVASAKVMAFVGSLVSGLSKPSDRPHPGAGYDQRRSMR